MASLAGLVFATVFISCYALLARGQKSRAQVGARVRKLTDKTLRADLDVQSPIPSLVQRMLKSVRPARPANLIGRKTNGVTWLQKLDVQLRRAEISLSSREFALRWTLMSAIVAVTVGFFFGISYAVVFVGCSYLGTLLYVRARISSRTRRVSDGLHPILVLITNALRAGQSFVQALHTVSQDGQGPLQEEFLRIEAELQLGATLEDAFMRANERIGSDDFDLIVTAILIQRQIGGNLAEVLEKIADTIRDRVRLKREVKALTSQGRLSASIFMVLPAGLGIILYMMNPMYISTLFQSPLGIAMLLIAGIGQLIGYVIIRRIVNVEL